MTDINIPPRDFKVGDEVVCLNFGIGQVTSNTGLYGFPIKVKFGNTKEAYTASGQFVPHGKRCLFHADENVKVTVIEPVYEWKVTFIGEYSGEWVVAFGWYKSINEFITLSEFKDDKACELIIQSKRLVKIN